MKFTLFVTLFLIQGIQTNHREIKVLEIRSDSCWSEFSIMTFIFINQDSDTNLLFYTDNEIPKNVRPKDTISLELYELKWNEKNRFTQIRSANYEVFCDNEFVFNQDTPVFMLKKPK